MAYIITGAVLVWVVITALIVADWAVDHLNKPRRMRGPR
jgi:hypothetical protein